MPPAAIAGGLYPNLSRGEGYGPPEISLHPLFTPLGSAWPNSFLQWYANLLGARYQEPNSNLMPASHSYNTANLLPGTASPTSPYPGITQWDDLLAAIRFNDYPYYKQPYLPSSFSQPPDLLGKGEVVLDVTGRPVFAYLAPAPTPMVGTPTLLDMVDDPYEFNLSRQAVRAAQTSTQTAGSPTTPSATLNPVDSPFSPAELEALTAHLRHRRGRPA